MKAGKSNHNVNHRQFSKQFVIFSLQVWDAIIFHVRYFSGFILKIPFYKPLGSRTSPVTAHITGTILSWWIF